LLNGKADTLKPNQPGLASELAFLTKVLHTVSSQWREIRAAEGREPSEASAFRNRMAGKGLIPKHPKGNNFVKQLEVLMASQSFPREYIPSHQRAAQAFQIVSPWSTHHVLGDKATRISTRVNMNNSSDHTLPSAHSLSASLSLSLSLTHTHTRTQTYTQLSSLLYHVQLQSE
jgi:hypothetical protein